MGVFRIRNVGVSREDGAHDRHLLFLSRPNGAVDNTFVQFYPTLIEVARSKGTLNAKIAQAEASEEQIVDVVCKMSVNRKDAVKADYKGKTHYFCQRGLQEQFRIVA